MSEPKLIFLGETPTPEGGTAQLCAMRSPDTGHVVLAFSNGETVVGAKLTAPQAIALAVELLAADVAALVKFAERLPDSVAAELGVAFFSAPATAALLRGAATGPEGA